MDRSDLANRMKDYESISKTKLMKRCPVICRIDGKAHHSFTRGFKRPFDEVYMKSMQETAKYLCENLQGVVLSYQQSDEITLVFVDYEKLNTSPYFDYEVQKLCSIIASMATMAFNKFFYENVFQYNGMASIDMSDKEYPYKEVYAKAIKNGAIFDARCFNIPKEEVANLIYWRQLDAMRHSVQAVGQANFSHKELQGKSCANIKEMLREKGVDWDSLPLEYQRGSCCIKKEQIIFPSGKTTAQLRDTSKLERAWIIDKEIPIFKGEGRKYIEDLIFIEEE